MKRIVITALTLCLLLTLCLQVISCGGGEVAPEGMQNVATENVGFLFYVPEGWLSQANSGVSGARYGNNEDKSNVTMTQYVPNTVEESDPTVYWSRFLKPEYEAMLEGFALVEEGADAKLGPRDAKRYVYTFKIGTVDYKQMQVIARGADSNVYIFTYTARPSFYDAHADEVASMLKEFRFG